MSFLTDEICLFAFLGKVIRFCSSHFALFFTWRLIFCMRMHRHAYRVVFAFLS